MIQHPHHVVALHVSAHVLLLLLWIATWTARCTIGLLLNGQLLALELVQILDLLR